MNIETFTTVGLQEALFGMREPLASHNLADSSWVYEEPNGEVELMFRIGEKDRALAKRLINAGPEHAKFLRMIHTYVRISAPLYWWKEFDTYRMGVEKNSGSTMHTIHKRKFTTDDFQMDMMSGDARALMHSIISQLNHLRMAVISEELSAGEKKEAWYQIIQLLPESYIQTRTVDLSYAALRSILRQRKGHKLKEWTVDFIGWAKSLPESWMLFEEDAER